MTRPGLSVPSRKVERDAARRIQIASSTVAPTARMVAWMTGGTSGSASFTAT